MRFILFLFLVYPMSSMGMEMFGEKVFEQPVREISVIITDDGFFPNKISAFEGERVKFFITSTAKDKQCFILQRHELFLGVAKGKVNEGEIVLNDAGRFRFFCPSHKKQGHLTVIGKKEEVETLRAPASVAKPKFWTPRDNEGVY